MRKRFYDNLLPYLLAHAGRLVSARFYREVNLTGTSLTRWRLLVTLYDGRPRAIGEIADEILLEQSSATRLIERTERAGLVAKRVDAADRRRSLVTITVSGRAFIRDSATRAVTVDARIMTEIPSEARRRLKKDLKRVISALAKVAREDSVHEH